MPHNFKPASPWAKLQPRVKNDAAYPWEEDCQKVEPARSYTDASGDHGSGHATRKRSRSSNLANSSRAGRPRIDGNVYATSSKLVSTTRSNRPATTRSSSSRTSSEPTFDTPAASKSVIQASQRRTEALLSLVGPWIAPAADEAGGSLLPAQQQRSERIPLALPFQLQNHATSTSRPSLPQPSAAIGSSLEGSADLAAGEFQTAASLLERLDEVPLLTERAHLATFLLCCRLFTMPFTQRLKTRNDPEVLTAQGVSFCQTLWGAGLFKPLTFDATCAKNRCDVFRKSVRLCYRLSSMVSSVRLWSLGHLRTCRGLCHQSRSLVQCSGSSKR